MYANSEKYLMFCLQARHIEYFYSFVLCNAKGMMMIDDENLIFRWTAPDCWHSSPTIAKLLLGQAPSDLCKVPTHKSSSSLFHHCPLSPSPFYPWRTWPAARWTWWPTRVPAPSFCRCTRIYCQYLQLVQRFRIIKTSAKKCRWDFRKHWD